MTKSLVILALSLCFFQRIADAGDEDLSELKPKEFKVFRVTSKGVEISTWHCFVRLSNGEHVLVLFSGITNANAFEYQFGDHLGHLATDIVQNSSSDLQKDSYLVNAYRIRWQNISNELQQLISVQECAEELAVDAKLGDRVFTSFGYKGRVGGIRRESTSLSVSGNYFEIIKQPRPVHDVLIPRIVSSNTCVIWRDIQSREWIGVKDRLFDDFSYLGTRTIPSKIFLDEVKKDVE